MSDSLLAIFLQQSESERVRRLLAGDALLALRRRVHTDAWRSFAAAARGCAAVQIGESLGISTPQVNQLLREAWSALTTLQHDGDARLRMGVIAVRQSCARIKEFQQLVDPVELRKASELGFWAALAGGLRRPREGRPVRSQRVREAKRRLRRKLLGRPRVRARYRGADRWATE